MNKQGWTWFTNAKKRHYFVDKLILCGRYALFTHPQDGYETDNNNSPDNCAACKRKLLHTSQQITA